MNKYKTKALYIYIYMQEPLMAIYVIN